jgi:hypothetical protein
MSVSNRSAKILVILGCIDLLVAAAVHFFGAYPGLSAALAVSNLIGPLKPAVRVVFLLVGWQWIVTAVIALLVVFTSTRLSKPIILICSIGLLVETALTWKFVGVFIGNEMIGSAALLLLFGGLSVGTRRESGV